MLTRPKITEELLTQIREAIDEHPDWGRRRLSIHLCELWDWRVPGGDLKDISCRDMLRALDKAGSIKLPASSKAKGQSPRRKILHQEHDTTTIACGLSDLRPISVGIVKGKAESVEWGSLVDRYHYLGFERTVGENMKYLVRSKDGVPLACLLFGSAAWSCRDRDALIGWDREQRMTGLTLMTNNTRFLIPEWVRVPHLASHVLSLIAHRISEDWEEKYGHGLVCLETFVERERFRGTCYQAANWIRAGTTTGRGRDDRKHARSLPEKDIYLLPLERRWKERLSGGSS
jgi:hypothetical protein